MPASKYYSPRLDRDLIASLYRTAKARRVPMTKLASAFVREALARSAASKEIKGPVLREEAPAADPGGQR